MTNSQRLESSQGFEALDPGLRYYLLNVYNHMGGGLVVTGAVAYATAASGFYRTFLGTPLFWIVLFAPLILVGLLSFRVERMSLGAAQLAFWSYAALVGLSLSTIFVIYTETSIAEAFFISAATFGAMSVVGYTSQTDISKFGWFLMMGLIGIIIASVVNLFLGSPAFQFAISIIGVVVFVGLTAWGTQRIKSIYIESEDLNIAGKKAIMGALALYLDFLNIFLLLLRLTGNRRR
jgi:uncharacterized protein